MALYCNHCEITVKTEEVANYTVDRTDDPTDKEKFSLEKCPECQNPILTKSTIVYVADEFFFGEATKLYPADEFYISPDLPITIKHALLESIRCFRAKSYTATAIMCRRTIEGFCEIKQARETNLFKSLEKLKNLGVINEQLHEWANQLRLVGNEAAHDISIEFSQVDAKDILDFTIAILDFTYSFKDKFDSFKARRTAQNNNNNNNSGN